MNLEALFAKASAWVAGVHGAPRVAIAVLVGLAVWLLVRLTAKGLLRAATRVAGNTQTTLDDELLARAEIPVRLLGPIVGIHVGSALFTGSGIGQWATVGEGLVLTYLAVSAFELLVIEAWLEQRQGVIVPPLVRQVVIGVIYGAVLLGVVGEVFDLDLTPLLATGSVTTVVVGLALQGPLSNLFAGLVLHVERHPRVGDWLAVDGREGQVLTIGWRTTQLRLFSDDVLVIPNVAITQAQVINHSQPSPVCARNLPVPVPLDLAPDRFTTWVREVAAGIDGVLVEPPPKVWLTAIDDHCQRYVVKLWVAEFRRHDDLESEFYKGLWYRFEREGVAFPARFQVIRPVDGAPPGMEGMAPVRRS